MKKTYLLIALTIVLSVFTICFLLGRAMVLNSENENKNDSTSENNGIVAIPFYEKETTETVGTEKQVPKIGDTNLNFSQETEKVPDRMLFPCGKDILKGYSQSAVRSKTTDDWRAHLGIDYLAEEGSAVLSAYDGTVLNVYEDKLWGFCVEILHTGNVVGIYRNLAENIDVMSGDVVKGGQVIARVGTSASMEKKEEPHLHFEIWLDGKPINPESFIY